MKVLVVNSGSSSLKYQLIETKTKEMICKGGFERINEGEFAMITHRWADQKYFDDKLICKTHATAIKKMLELLTDSKVGVIKSLQEIDAIGHRVVHGGEIFKESTLATEDTLREVEKLTDLAPLHNPANVVGVRECVKVLPNVPNVMVFDTAFHSTMPKSAYLYALPEEDYTNHKIRKYGFHGTSHNYVAKKAAEMANADLGKLKIVTCHIGNGCSIAAIDGGRSVDTSLGMTPLSGLVMGTRSGDIDPAVIEVLCKTHKFTINECINYLNKNCGLLGLSGFNNDMRDLQAEKKNRESAQTAIDCFVRRIVHYIGAYIAVMNGVDIIVWTGGIGNNVESIREDVMKHFGYVGAFIDDGKNNICNSFEGANQTMDITKPGSRVKTMVINTNEELEIATETEKVLGK